MVDLSIVDALGIAKERIERGWCRGSLKNPEGDVCSVGSLYYTTSTELRHKSYKFLGGAIGVVSESPRYLESAIIGWNDNLGNTKQEVVCAFSKAIELAIEEAYREEGK